MEPEKFEDILRDKFSDYAPSVEPEDWEIIRSRLAGRRKRIIPLWAYTAAASLLITAAGITLFRHNRGEASGEQIRNRTTAYIEEFVRSHPETPLALSQERVEGEPPAEVFVSAAEERPTGLSEKPIAAAVAQSPQDSKETSTSSGKDSRTDISDDLQNRSAEAGAKKEKRKKNTPPVEDTSLLLADASSEISARKDRGRASLSIGMHAGNQSGMAEKTGEPSALRSFSNSLTEYNTVGTAYSGNQDLKHDFPITAGIALRYKFNRRIGIETGIAYSYLCSKAELEGVFSYRKKQQINYLGIPLGISYSMISTPSLDFYAKAAGQADFCVGARKTLTFSTAEDGIRTWQKEVSNFKIKHVQWSASLGIGLTYNFIRHMGLYLEPGLAYYFPYENQIETYWSEKPLNFSLRFGVRFNI